MYGAAAVAHLSAEEFPQGPQVGRAIGVRRCPCVLRNDLHLSYLGRRHLAEQGRLRTAILRHESGTRRSIATTGRIGSEFSRQRQQATPHPRRAQHTTWVASWSRGGPRACAHNRTQAEHQATTHHSGVRRGEAVSYGLEAARRAATRRRAPVTAPSERACEAAAEAAEAVAAEKAPALWPARCQPGAVLPTHHAISLTISVSEKARRAHPRRCHRRQDGCRQWRGDQPLRARGPWRHLVEDVGFSRLSHRPPAPSHRSSHGTWHCPGRGTTPAAARGTTNEPASLRFEESRMSAVGWLPGRR